MYMMKEAAMKRAARRSYLAAMKATDSVWTGWTANIEAATRAAVELPVSLKAKKRRSTVLTMCNSAFERWKPAALSPHIS